MKVASIEWKDKVLCEMFKPVHILEKIEAYIKIAAAQACDIIVFPAFTGCYYEQLKYIGINLQRLKTKAVHNEYVEYMRQLSGKYKIVICTGSYWEKHDSCTYHTAGIVRNGQVILEQRQIYLARWERELGFERGIDIQVIDIYGWKIGIILSTDVFYSQVARMMALEGVDVVLSPIGFVTDRAPAFQLSGMWQQVQQNQFFAVESAFNGKLGNMNIWGESIIHGPLDITEQGNGMWAKSNGKKIIITAQLDNEQRRKTISRYNVLSQLNVECYQNMKIFEGKNTGEKFI
ncbi:carbon-nitrogen hydrolase family protein [Petroclostridium sp. X23]|uniref:carbon-nitrogen hydrolase family protein n=1 Tax=Petroclostridium sp. X23 TaxID=3045146 RepID=UPI0024AD449A|nr:carbon-nitrogen hydrolase family protein [Petroclostridium sp. X23]WHH60309.1 carbon-nitrogen hydrolase family protein [Petroclostridium sp. X23]